MADRRKKLDRREASDRRRTDRRRKGDTRVFVIELTGEDLCVAQLDRAATPDGVDQVSAWATRWRNTAATLESPEGQAELTAALREAARRHNMWTADVRIVLSGEFCITRTVRGAVEEVRAELQRLEQRSRLYLSLGPGEKVLVGHTRLLNARHAHALAAACNKATLEAIQASAENAGLVVSMIEPALSALSRAVSRLPDVPTEPFLLIHFAESATEIGICHEGRLLLDYRPGGSTAVAELPALLGNHLNRLNRHVARYLRSPSAGSLKQVLLCGDADSIKTAAQQFRRRSPLEVRTVRPSEVKATWQLREDAADVVSAQALGNLLLSYLPAEECDAPNFMQHLLEGRQEPLRPYLLRSAVPIAATLLIAAGLAWINSRENNSLQNMQADIDALAVQAARATELRLQLSTSEAKLDQLQKLATKLPPGLGDDAIRRVSGCMPNDVWLTQLLVTDRTEARLQGASYLEAGVYDFVRWLELAPGFEEVALKRTTAATSASGPTTSFELEMNLGENNDQATRVARHD